VSGPGGFLGTKEIYETRYLIAALVMIIGPTTAGILLTGLIDGRAGLREL